MSLSATVTSKGQITIPAPLRARLKLAPGDRLSFVENPDGSLRVVKDTRSFNDLRGIIKVDRPWTTEEITQAVEDARDAMAAGDDRP